MRVIEATPKDGPALIEFFAKNRTMGYVDYTLHRKEPFFAKYQILSQDFLTLLLMDRDEILGVATLVFVPMKVNGNIEIVAYAMDLRIAQVRKAILTWAPLFFHAFEEACRARNCNYIFSTLELGDQQSYNALVRPQRTRRKLPRYYLFWKAQWVAIVGRWPTAKPLASLSFTRGSAASVDEMMVFYRSHQQGKVLSLPMGSKDFTERLSRWPGLKLEDFVIARNANGDIVGCAGPWRMSDLVEPEIHNYPGRAGFIAQSTRTGKWLGLTRPLPHHGERLKLLALTHIACDNPDIFSSLLYHCYDTAPKGHTLIYTNFKGDYSMRPPLSFIATSMPFAFYTVLPPEAELPDILRPNPWIPPPDLDLAWFF